LHCSSYKSKEKQQYPCSGIYHLQSEIYGFLQYYCILVTKQGFEMWDDDRVNYGWPVKSAVCKPLVWLLCAFPKYYNTM